MDSYLYIGIVLAAAGFICAWLNRESVCSCLKFFSAVLLLWPILVASFVFLGCEAICELIDKKRGLKP